MHLWNCKVAYSLIAPLTSITGVRYLDPYASHHLLVNMLALVSAVTYIHVCCRCEKQQKYKTRYSYKSILIPVVATLSGYIIRTRITIKDL